MSPAAYRNYIVQQGDTLESICSNRLGSADRWREVAFLNKLRWPFISDDPVQQYGAALTTGTLTTAIATNAMTYQFTPAELPVYAVTYTTNAVFYVQSIGATGAVTYDAMVLASPVDESTGLLTFNPSVSLSLRDPITASLLVQSISVSNMLGVTVGTKLVVDAGLSTQETVTVANITPPSADVPQITAVFTQNHLAGAVASYGFQNGYAAGTAFSLFSPPRDNRQRVLRTGDRVSLPLSPGASTVGDTSDNTFASLLGTDILLGRDGTIQFGVSGGPIKVAGIQNLAQALRLRLATPAHSYDRYPNYGNPLWDFVGQNTEPYFVTLVTGLVRQALLSDPRVGSVESIAVSITGSSVKIDAQIKIIESSQLVRVDNLIISIGR